MALGITFFSGASSRRRWSSVAGCVVLVVSLVGWIGEMRHERRRMIRTVRTRDRRLEPRRMPDGTLDQPADEREALPATPAELERRRFLGK